MRRFKTELAARYARFDQLLTAHKLADDATALAIRSSLTGGHRAFDRLCKILTPFGATLEGVRLEGKYSLAVWSILRPRESVVLEPDNPSDAQDCITVKYFLAGKHPDGRSCYSEGLWTLEVTDHALGRLIQRQSAADPAADIVAAHHAALRLRQEDAAPYGLNRDTFLVCSTACGHDVSINEHDLRIRAHTWLHNDQLRTDQTPLIDDGSPGHRTGDNWLLPAPLRFIVVDSDRMAVTYLWAPGLLETLAKPAGRA